jgi:protein involved in polysaccharide export with SLBB domain
MSAFQCLRAIAYSMALLIALLPFGAPLPAQPFPGGSDVLTLQPGDVIRITIWREEDLNGEFQIDENGTVILPLLGEKRVAGIAFRNLREMLTDEYRVHLRNPSITITPLRRINVLGEVNQPGLYAVDPTISLAGVVALAGGTNASGDLNRIRILRSGRVLQERVTAAASLQASDIRSGDQILIGRRGWFDRNSTFVVSALLSISSIVISLTR